MKVSEIIQEDQLDELKLRHALGVAAVSAAAAFHHGSKPVEKPDQPTAQVQSHVKQKSEEEKLTDIILDKYKIDPELAQEIVKLAKKHQKSSFPRATDILALIGIESSFNPHAVSKLKTDPAIGLTQIRPISTGISRSQLVGNIENQIAKASDLLYSYYKRFGTEDHAIYAYNIGPTSLKKIMKNKKPKYSNPQYVQKFKQELKRYT